jgi:hypothetical protein
MSVLLRDCCAESGRLVRLTTPSRCRDATRDPLEDWCDVRTMAMVRRDDVDDPSASRLLPGRVPCVRCPMDLDEAQELGRRRWSGVRTGTGIGDGLARRTSLSSGDEPESPSDPPPRLRELLSSVTLRRGARSAAATSLTQSRRCRYACEALCCRMARHELDEAARIHRRRHRFATIAPSAREPLG